MNRKSEPRWWRFSVRSLLILTALVSMAIAAALAVPVQYTAMEEDLFEDGSFAFRLTEMSRSPTLSEILVRLALGLPAMLLVWAVGRNAWQRWTTREQSR